MNRKKKTARTILVEGVLLPARSAARLIPLPAGVRMKTAREVKAGAMRRLDARAKGRQEPALRVVKGD